MAKSYQSPKRAKPSDSAASAAQVSARLEELGMGEDKALDGDTLPNGDSIEEAIKKLTPDEAAMFVAILEKTMRKRRLMLVGNLLALLIMVIGTLAAFVVYANRDEGQFMAWVFLLPFGLGGAVLNIFGKMAKKAGHQALSIDSPIQSKGENAA